MKPTGYRQNWAKDKQATAKSAGKATKASFATKRLVLGEWDQHAGKGQKAGVAGKTRARVLDDIERAVGGWTGTTGRSARASAAGGRGAKARAGMKLLDQIIGGAG